MAECPACGGTAWHALPLKLMMCGLRRSPQCGSGRGFVCVKCDFASCGMCVEGAPAAAAVASAVPAAAAPAAAAAGRGAAVRKQAITKKNTTITKKKKKKAAAKKMAHFCGQFSYTWTQAEQKAHNGRVKNLRPGGRPIEGGAVPVSPAGEVLSFLMKKWTTTKGHVAILKRDRTVYIKGYNQWSSTIGEFSDRLQALHTLKFREHDQDGVNTLEAAKRIPGMKGLIKAARQVRGIPLEDCV